MSCHSKNTLGNLYGKSMHQRSNDPTKRHIKIYNVLFQFFMFLFLCWNVNFLLECVGIKNLVFHYLVGTKKVFRRMLERSNKNTNTNLQIVIQNNGFLLERWYVGTPNDRQL